MNMAQVDREPSTALSQQRWWSKPWQRGVTALMLWGGAALYLLPLVWMISSSLKLDHEVLAASPIWWPAPPVWSNYPEALSYVPFGRYALNTLAITAVTVVGHIVSCTLVAYGFARLHAPGREVLFLILLATMMLPYPVTMVPLYILFKTLGWVNTFLPLTVPSFLGQPFYIFLLRQFLRSIPNEFEEAAYMDGARIPQIIWHIILPLAKPALATTAIFTFQSTWNDFMGPLIYLHKQSLYMVTLGLSFFRSTYTVKWAYLMAASVMAVLPVIIVFIVAQRSFVEGINLTGLKG